MKIKIDVNILGINPSTTNTIYRDALTVGYCFINSGNTPVQINNYNLLPNSVWKTFEPGIEDTTIYRIRFDQRNQFYPTCSDDTNSLTVLIYSKVL
jgi:hypothetical protein